MSPTHTKNTMHSLHQMKVLPPPSSRSPPALTSMKIKTLVHTLIIARVCRLVRALSKAKAILIKHIMYPQNKSKHYKKKIFFGSFRLHYNYCSSSHVAPVPAPILNEYLYYDSTWNSVAKSADADSASSPQLTGYLQWLEDKMQDSDSCSEEEKNEIDKLADMFIANCHEKFRLEKVESYRRFQEMLARSV